MFVSQMFTTKSPLINTVINDTATSLILYLNALQAQAAAQATSGIILDHIAHELTCKEKH